MKTKAKSKPVLYIGRTSCGYELGNDRSLFDKGYGFHTGSRVLGICTRMVNHFVGKLQIGEVRRLHVRIGK